MEADEKKKARLVKFIRVLLFICIILIAAGLIYFAFLRTMPELFDILKSGDEQLVENYLRHSDRISGLICTAALQVVQVLSIVLPGAPIQIAAGIVFGIWRAFFICHLSSVLTNLIVFVAAKKLGSSMDKWLPVRKKSSSRIEAFKKNAVYMTLIACLIPVLPNGFIPYFAAKTDIKWWKFLLAMYFGSLFPVLLLCAMGNRILKGDYLLAVILCAALIAIVVALYFLQPVLSKFAAYLKAKRDTKKA